MANRKLSRGNHQKHGMSYTGTYRIWHAMLSRCLDPKDRSYKNYGGRGITVCEKWMTFSGFFEDMGEKPKGLTIDRLNNNEGYSKSNCQWRSNYRQARNKSTNRWITFEGRTMCITDWARELDIKIGAMIYRLRKWPLEQAMNPKKQVKGPNREKITFEGKTQTIAMWAKEKGLSRRALLMRIERNWPLVDALNIPPGTHHRYPHGAL